MKRLHAAPDGVAQIDHQMAEMAAGVAQVFNVQHTSPTEMAGMYVLASTMGMVPTLSASEIVARLGLRWQDLLVSLPGIVDRFASQISAKVGDIYLEKLRCEIKQLQVQHVHTAVLLQQLEVVLSSMFVEPWAHAMSDAGHVAWLAFALCRRRIATDTLDRDDPSSAIVADFKLLLVVTTALLVPNAPPGCLKNNITPKDMLSLLAEEHEVPLADLQDLVPSAVAVLDNVLGARVPDSTPTVLHKPPTTCPNHGLRIPEFCQASGAIAPWVAACLTDAHAAALASQGGVDEAMVWQHHGVGGDQVKSTPPALLSPPSAMQRLAVSTPSSRKNASSAYKTLYIAQSHPTPARDDDEEMDAVNSPSRRPPSTTPPTAAAWLQQIHQQHQDDMDMLRLLCASSSVLGGHMVHTLLDTIPQEARRPFEGRGRLHVLLGGVPPAQARGQEVTALYVHCARRMLQYEMQQNGAEAVAVLVASSTFRRSLLACCVDMVACVYAQAATQFPHVLTTYNLSALDFYKMAEQLLHFARDAPRPLRYHLLQGMERCLEDLLWAVDSPLVDLWHVYAPALKAAAGVGPSTRQGGPTRASPSQSGEGAGSASCGGGQQQEQQSHGQHHGQQEREPVGHGGNEQEQGGGVPAKRRRQAHSTTSNHSRVAQEHSSDDSMTQLVPNAPKTSTSVNQPVLDTHMHNTTNTTTTTNPPTNRPQSNQHPPQPSYNTLTRRGSLASLIVTSPTGGVKRNHLAAFAPLVEAAGIVGDAQDNTHDAHPHAGGTTGTTIGTTMTVDHVDQPMTQDGQPEGAVQQPKHSTAQLAMLTRLQQRLLHLASVKLAALTQVAGMSDPQRQCAALQHTMGVLQEVLRSHVELLVGRHLDQLLVAVLFCVCEALHLEGVTLHTLEQQYRRHAAGTAAAHGDALGQHVGQLHGAPGQLLKQVALTVGKEGQSTPTYGTLADYTTRIVRHTLSTILSALPPLTPPPTTPHPTHPPPPSTTEGAALRASLHTPPPMLPPAASPPLASPRPQPRAAETPPGSPRVGGRRVSLDCSGAGPCGVGPPSGVGVVRAAHNVFISPMSVNKSGRGCMARPCATTPQSVRPTPQQPSFTALPLTPARHATPTPKGPPGIMLLSTVADILELDAL